MSRKVSATLPDREQTVGSALAAPARTGVLPWQVSLVALSAIWGSSFLFIKLADASFTAVQMSLARMLLASAILLVILAVRRESLPRGVRLWGHLFVVGMLLNVLPFTTLAFGETRTTSILAGIWNATTPLFTVLLVMLTEPEERPTPTRGLGLALGFAGVLTVQGVWNGIGGNQMIGNLACLVGAAAFGTGLLYMRKHLSKTTATPMGVVTGQLLAATVELTILLPFLGGIPGAPSTKAFVSVLILGVFGTGLAYILNYGLIRDAGATVASTVTYLIPLFSTLAGVLFLGEPLTWNEPIGAAIIIVGVVVAETRIPSLRTAS